MRSYTLEQRCYRHCSLSDTKDAQSEFSETVIMIRLVEVGVQIRIVVVNIALISCGWMDVGISMMWMTTDGLSKGLRSWRRECSFHPEARGRKCISSAPER